MAGEAGTVEVFPGQVMTLCPLRRIVKRCAISKTSSSLWETKRMAMPRIEVADYVEEGAHLLLRQAVVGSSMMMSFRRRL